MKVVTAKILSSSSCLKYGCIEYRLVRLDAPEIARTALPGQFIMIRCGDDFRLRRPLSLHSVDTINGEIEILFSYDASIREYLMFSRSARMGNAIRKNTGISWLRERRRGDLLEIIGPLGNGFSVSKNSKHLLLLAGGIGIAPLRFLAERLASLGINCTLIIGARTAKAVYPGENLPGVTNNIVVTEDGSMGLKGMLTAHINQYIANADQVIACGPVAMYMSLYRQQKKYKWHQSTQVSLEVRMGCGFGVCYGCSIKTRYGMKRVCRDGPVFDIKDIIWQEVQL